MPSFVDSILHGATTILATLPQQVTNGNCKLGALDAPALPLFLTNNPLHGGTPWGNAAPNGPAPNTGVVRSYNFTISRGYASPDGYNKSVILINNQFPGPLIEANWGDTIRVTVDNQIWGPPEGTTVHWHGQSQRGSPWYDGVPSVSQCPLAPGASFTYSFVAQSYGTSWYHSHYSAQYIDGVFGPLVVYGPSNVHYDVDLGPIMLTDYFHLPYLTFVEEIFQQPPEFAPVANNLINGKMDFDCSLVTDGTACRPNAGISKFSFQTGKVHRLRLINAGSAGTQKFSIDGYDLTVIANDYIPIIPYTTKVITLGVGQRADILVKAEGKPTDAVWMRSDLEVECLNVTAIQPNALAAIYYPKADINARPNTTATGWTSNACRNDPLNATAPFYLATPPSQPAFTHNLDITVGVNGTGILLFFVDNSTFRGNYDHPILLLSNLGSTSYPYEPQWNVHNFYQNTSIRLVIRNNYPTSHPMHLHGHAPWILAEGFGDWDGTIINPSNPQRRDVQLMAPAAPDGTPSYVVFEWQADSPGVWPLHCHLAVHVSAGLFINIIERPDLIKNYSIPPSLAQTCQDWATFSNHTVVDVIDSGV